jgi:hypothetical protein
MILDTQSNPSLTTEDSHRELLSVRYGIRRVPTGARYSNVYHVIDSYTGKALYGTCGLWFSTRRKNAATIVTLLKTGSSAQEIICGGRFL